MKRRSITVNIEVPAYDSEWPEWCDDIPDEQVKLEFRASVGTQNSYGEEPGLHFEMTRKEIKSMIGDKS